MNLFPWQVQTSGLGCEPDCRRKSSVNLQRQSSVYKTLQQSGRFTFMHAHYTKYFVNPSTHLSVTVSFSQIYVLSKVYTNQDAANLSVASWRQIYLSELRNFSFCSVKIFFSLLSRVVQYLTGISSGCGKSFSNSFVSCCSLNII